MPTTHSAADSTCDTARRATRYPFSAYPSGWYCVAMVADIPAGGVVSLHYFGRELVAFRGADGGLRLTDAFCPHLGAHLGVGGSVEGNAIRCPFHAWLFDGDSGQCLEVPYARRIPRGARLRTWLTREWAGMLLAYYPGEHNHAPWVPALPDCNAPHWQVHATRSWRVRTHVQEIGENGLDVAHVGPVHGSDRLDITKLETDGPVMRLATEPCDPARAQFRGVIRRTLWGLGLSMNEFIGDVESRVSITRTPLDADQVEVRMVFVPKCYADTGLTRLIGDALTERVAAEFEGDIGIWEHKAYLASPVLCDGDGPINKWRNWARQFY